MKNLANFTQGDAVTASTFPCRVKEIKPLSINTVQVDLETPHRTSLNYIAGHYLKIELDVNNDGQKQSLFYSITNIPDAEHPNLLKIFIQTVSPSSEAIIKCLSRCLKNTTIINVTLPMGKSFLQTDINLTHLLVAAGSGIAKIKCLAEAIIKQNPNANVYIYWSNRQTDEFYLLDELQNLTDQYNNLHFTPILEKATTSWSGRSGYIYEVIQQDFETLDNVQTYLCGSPNMVYGTIDCLKPHGLKEENCFSDVFEYAPRKS